MCGQEPQWEGKLLGIIKQGRVGTQGSVCSAEGQNVEGGLGGQG